MPNLNAILVYFSPELILVIGGLVVLTYDLIIRGRDRHQGAVAVVVLLLAALATLMIYPDVESGIRASNPELGANLYGARGLEVGAEVPVEAEVELFEVRSPDGELLRHGTFVVDGFTNFFRLISIFTALIVLLSGLTFMRGKTPFKGEFYAFVLFASLAMCLMAGANDLIMIMLAIEFLSIVSYLLTGFLRDSEESNEGGLKYLLYGSITSAVMLFGLTYVYGAAGTTSLPGIAAAVTDPRNIMVSQIDTLILPALVMVMVGLGFKIALVPFHHWSPDAYQGAPTPVTSFLSVGPKAAGFAVLLRLFTTVFYTPLLSVNWISLLSILAILTMVVGNLAALRQTNVKRMLAYSSIAQAGYMLVGVAAWTGGGVFGGESTGISAVLFYILAYLFTNLGAFAIVIAVEHQEDSAELEAFDGLMQRSPLLAVSFTVFFLSLLGIPPLAGFVGKFAVFGAAVITGNTTLAVIGVLAGVISVVYYFRVIKRMYFHPAEEEAAPIRLAPAATFAVVLSLVMVFAIGIFAEPFLEIAQQAASVLEPLAEQVVQR